MEIDTGKREGEAGAERDIRIVKEGDGGQRRLFIIVDSSSD